LAVKVPKAFAQRVGAGGKCIHQQQQQQQ